MRLVAAMTEPARHGRFGPRKAAHRLQIAEAGAEAAAIFAADKVANVRSLRRALGRDGEEAVRRRLSAPLEEKIEHCAATLEMLDALALADEQVTEAAGVLAEHDPNGVGRIREHDLEINSANRRCFELAIRDGDDETRREAAFFVAMMARALERIGDNAVDIARQASFAVTGRLRSDAAP